MGSVTASSTLPHASQHTTGRNVVSAPLARLLPVVSPDASQCRRSYSIISSARVITDTSVAWRSSRGVEVTEDGAVLD